MQISCANIATVCIVTSSKTSSSVDHCRDIVHHIRLTDFLTQINKHHFSFLSPFSEKRQANPITLENQVRNWNCMHHSISLSFLLRKHSVQLFSVTKFHRLRTCLIFFLLIAVKQSLEVISSISYMFREYNAYT